MGINNPNKNVYVSGERHFTKSVNLQFEGDKILMAYDYEDKTKQPLDRLVLACGEMDLHRIGGGTMYSFSLFSNIVQPGGHIKVYMKNTKEQPNSSSTEVVFEGKWEEAKNSQKLKLHNSKNQLIWFGLATGYVIVNGKYNPVFEKQPTIVVISGNQYKGIPKMFENSENVKNQRELEELYENGMYPIIDFCQLKDETGQIRPGYSYYCEKSRKTGHIFHAKLSVGSDPKVYEKLAKVTKAFMAQVENGGAGHDETAEQIMADNPYGKRKQEEKIKPAQVIPDTTEINDDLPF